MRPLFLFDPKTGIFYHRGVPSPLRTIDEFIGAGLMIPVGEGEDKIIAKPEDSEYVLGPDVVMAETADVSQETSDEGLV